MQDFYLNIKLEDGGIPPVRSFKSAGLDFFSPDNYTIFPYGDILIPLQIRTEFPDGYAMIFKEKSGVAMKKKLSIGANLIDSEYRGIIHAHFFNHSNKTVTISKGEKIIQAIIVPVYIGNYNIVENFNIESTVRKDGGFGSTGV